MMDSNTLITYNNKVICPRCNGNGFVYKADVKGLKSSLYICDECEYMCTLEIYKDVTKVSLQFFDESKPSECSISTNDLKDIIILWMKENKNLIEDTK